MVLVLDHRKDPAFQTEGGKQGDRGKIRKVEATEDKNL
jgi:hypothetical protein